MTAGSETGDGEGKSGAQETCVDLHVKVLDESVVERAKAAGLDVLVYAPHFSHIETIRERAARFSDDDLLVVPAREYFTGSWANRKHVLAVDPKKPLPDYLPLDYVMGKLDDQDCGVLVPHPEFLTLSMDRDDIATYEERIDAIEVYNPKHWPRDNRRARSIARERGLPTYISSYAHLDMTVGEAWTAFERDIDSAADLVDAIRSGVPRRMYHRDGITHTLKCRAEFCHLGWENSWEKFDRIVLSDGEETYPSHPKYNGQYDDLSVY